MPSGTPSKPTLIAVAPLRLVHWGVGEWGPFQHAEVAANGLRVLCGQNGSGKSLLLDALALLGEAARGQLAAGLAARGGMAALRRQTAAKGAAVVLRAEAEAAGEGRWRYELALGRKGPGFEVVAESLLLDRPAREVAGQPLLVRTGTQLQLSDGSHLFDSDAELSPQESALGQLADMPRTVERFAKLLGSVAVLQPIDARRGAPVRMPQRRDAVPSVGANGQWLAAHLWQLQQRHPPAFARVEAAVRCAFADLAALELAPAGVGEVALQWCANTGLRYGARELSEGKLRLVWLAAALLAPNRPATVCIDLPETALHPTALPAVLQLLRESATAGTVLAATHSAGLAAALQPQETALLTVDPAGDAHAVCGEALEQSSDSW